jgi:predicted dehydrogenase
MGISRRRFVSALTLACATPLFSAEPSRRFKAGFLGASYSHAKDKIRLVGAHPAFELVGGCEKSERVRAAYPNLRWLSREELLQICEVIFVESDVRDHGRDTLDSLRAGRHVHAEKPPSADWEQMVEIVRLAREKDLLLQSGYMWRYHPGFDAIFEAVRNGWLGEIYQVQAHMSNLLAPAERPVWAEFKGGSFFEQGSHLLDVMIRLLGKPVSVASELRSTGSDGLADNNLAVFQFPKAIGTISNSANQSHGSEHRTFEVRGMNGTMTLKPIEPPSLQIDLLKPAGPYKSGSQQATLPAFRRYEGDLENLASALSGKTKLKVSLDEELLVHEWLLRACKMM